MTSGPLQNTQAEKQTKVLLVDDYPVVTDFLEALLIHRGFKIVKAFGGEEAILKASKEQPDVIILDLAMPNVSGYEVAERLKQNEETASIPIIVLTAIEISPEEHERLDKNVQVVIQKKQFLVENLLAEIAKLKKSS